MVFGENDNVVVREVVLLAINLNCATIRLA